MYRKPLAEITAERIRAYALEKKLGRLPSAKSLSDQFLVGIGTVAKAVRILENEAFLEAGRGHRCLVRQFAQNRAPAPARISSHEKVLNEITARISAGAYTEGMPLPKVDSFARELRVSNQSVLLAYRELVSRGYAQKNGKKYLVGSGELPQVRITNLRSRPVILAVLGNRREWFNIARSNRTGTFAARMSSEIQSHGIQVMKFVLDESDVSRNDLRSIQTLHATIKELGGRYLGTLCLTSEKFAPNWQWILSDLTRYPRPVVWLDRYKEGLARKTTRNPVIRCHIDENAGVESMLEYLSEMGHTNLGYFLDWSDQTWQRTRLKQMIELAGKYGMKIFCEGPDLIENWAAPEASGLLRKITELQRRIPAVERALTFFEENENTLIARYGAPSNYQIPTGWKGLLAYHAHLSKNEPKQDTEEHWRYQKITSALNISSVLKHSSVTCLVAPNDLIGSTVLLPSLAELNMRCPSDISLVAFDNNYPDPFLNTLTSVDFGLNHLGSSAVHAILQDLPVATDRDHVIHSAPFIVDRGSVLPRPIN